MGRRATGRFGPNSVSHILRQEIGPNLQTQGWLQWGICEAVHGALYTNTTLYATASAGASSVELNAKPLVNDFLVIGTLTAALQVLTVTGSSAPYTATLKGTIASTQTSGLAVVALWTVDLYINGTQNLPAPPSGSFLQTGIRFEEGWNPVVGDVVPIIRGPGGLVTDRFVLRELVGKRGPGGSCFVGLTSGAPPSTVPFGIGSLFVDPTTPRFYVCTVGSIQNSAGVVTTPATWHYATLT